MAELDQHCPTTSTFHRPTMEESVIKLKRLQRFTRQFSLFVHCEEEKLPKIKSVSPAVKVDENKEDHLFKYPGNVRAVKRKRTISKPSPDGSIVTKRKMMGHQNSIREDFEEPLDKTEVGKKQDKHSDRREKKEDEGDGEELEKDFK